MSMVYRFMVLSTFVTNLIFIIIVYFLWKSIYGTSEMLHGMTFHQTFIHLTLAAAILNALRGSSVSIAGSIRSGMIAFDLVRPLDFQLKLLAESIGAVILGLLTNTVPCAIVVYILVRGDIPVGINIPFFLSSFVGAYLVNFTLDFTVASIAFYTQGGMWGITVAKEIVSSFLAGAIIPFAFFPDSIQTILRVLPFQTIFHTPLQILTNTNLTTSDYLSMISVQVFWLMLLFIGSRLFFRQAIKVLTINGG
jgi:ABC-2 type transport system permease protein